MQLPSSTTSLTPESWYSRLLPTRRNYQDYMSHASWSKPCVSGRGREKENSVCYTRASGVSWSCSELGTCFWVNQHHCSEVPAKEPTRSLFLLEPWIFFCLLWLLLSFFRACSRAKGRLYQEVITKCKWPRISPSDINRVLLLILDGVIDILRELCGWKLPSWARTPKVSFHVSGSHPWMTRRVQYVFEFSIMRNYASMISIFSLIVFYRFPCFLYSTFVFAVSKGGLT